MGDRVVDWMLARVQDVAWRVADRIDAHWQRRAERYRAERKAAR